MNKLSILILITSMSIQTQANNNNVVVSDNPTTKEIKTKPEALKKDQAVMPKSKKDVYPGVEWKPKTELDKDRNKYPGVEWKPKEGDPIPNQNENAYPGVEWTPKK